jgi:hypothetical protein
MTTANETNVAHAFKRRYSDRQVAQIVMRESPTFNAITKEGGFDGSGLFYGITYGNPQGVSSGFSSAQTAAEPLQGAQLAVYRKLKYGVIQLDGPAMEAAKGNKGSFFDFVTRHTDGILEQLGHDLAFDLLRDGSGVRGRRSSAAANIITLTNPTDVDYFKVGMTVVAGPNPSASGLRTGSTTVAKLNRKGGTVELASAAAISGFLDNDYLFRLGDPGACMEGMGLCTPLTAPGGGDSFRTINRSVDVEALAGSRIDDTSIFPEESLGDVAVNISTIGKKVKKGVVYPTVFQAMVKRTGAKVEYEPGATADIGFEYINLLTAAGRIQIYSDADAVKTEGRVFRPDTHVLKHLNEVVHVIRTNGLPQMQLTTADGIEIRTRFMGNYVQFDTAPHGVVSIA